MRLTKTYLRKKYNTLVDWQNANAPEIARVLVKVDRALTDKELKTLKAYLMTEGRVQMLEDLIYS